MSKTLTPSPPLTREPKTIDSPVEYFQSAQRLHGFLLKRHWISGAVWGPDSGVRFNARIGRFIKGYLNFLPWKDEYAYIQSQTYWILSNWLMFDLTGNAEFECLALQGTEFVCSKQRPEGYWEYPNPEWKDRIATVEGCLGTLALLESYRRTDRQEFVDAAKTFYQYLVEQIGFRQQTDPTMLAVNYFARTEGSGGGVPNNSTLLLWMLAELARSTRDEKYLEYCAPMVTWLRHVQMPNGELPYSLGNVPEKDRTHFLCFQYNAFEFLDLVHYYQLTDDQNVLPTIERLAGFLAGGFAETGACRFDCKRSTPEVNYYSIALASALSQAHQMGFGTDSPHVQRAWRRVLSNQRADGGFQFFSRFNYGFLSDRRSYPRNLSMMLYHLLSEAKAHSREIENGQSFASGPSRK